MQKATDISNGALLTYPRSFEDAGWKPVSQSEGSNVYSSYEKNLGLLARILDLAKRILICFGFDKEGSLDRIKIFNCFELPKFWSGKRILYTEEIGPTSKVEEISSTILEDSKSGPPTCFLEQVSQEWTVRNPSEPNRKFRNPKKTTATSRLEENTKSACSQQLKGDLVSRTPEKRQKEFTEFLDKFKIKTVYVNMSYTDENDVVVDKRCRVNTKCDRKNKNIKIFELQRFHYGISSTQGIRDSMEDAHAVFELDGHPCFVVFDGHGGAEDANYCANQMQNVLKEYLKQSGKTLVGLNDAELILFFKKAFIILDKEVKAKPGRDPENNPQGTTVALNVIIGNRNICVNLGDSRTVIVNDRGVAVQISIDAKCTDPKYSKVVTENGGYISGDNRVNGDLAVPRDIGGCGYDCVSPVPTLSEYTIGEYMIIACDGLWDVLTTLEAGELLTLMKNRGYGVDAMSQALIKLAMQRGTDDNVSVIVVKTSN